MTETKIIEKDRENYNKFFSCNIDLQDCDDSDMEDIIECLENCLQKMNMNSWLMELIEIIKNGN